MIEPVMGVIFVMGFDVVLVVWGDGDETDMGFCVDALYLELADADTIANRMPAT